MDASCGVGDAVSPEHELPVAAVAGEMDALFDQTRAQARTARVGLYQEGPELCDLVAPTDDEDAADISAVHLGDPAALLTVLLGRIVAVHEVRYDVARRGPRTWRSNRILGSTARRDAARPNPYHRGVSPQEDERLCRGIPVHKDLSDGWPCAEKLLLILLKKAVQHPSHLLA